jgi:hypothetical protein
MAEPERPDHPAPNPRISAAEHAATTNLAAFLHWLRAVHGLCLAPRDSPPDTLRAWAETSPETASAIILRFAGPGFASARLAAGLLLQADLRPDDRILVMIEGAEPDWLPEALQATQGRAMTAAEATVLIAEEMPEQLPQGVRRVILTGGGAAPAAADITVSRSADWTYPRESKAD